MTRDYDLIVLGGGPAGANAALQAADAGVGVLLVDDNPAVGGQVYRALPGAFRASAAQRKSPDHEAGERLRERIATSAVSMAREHSVWSVAPGYRVDAVGPDGPVSWSARHLVVAAGTTERVVPFPGWTTPGVIGLAAATVLLKSQQVLPGRRTVVAGCGPLLAAVAAGIVKHGGSVPALLDLNALADWARAAPALAGRPALAWRGSRWLSTVRRSGTVLLYRHAIREIQREGEELVIETGPVDRDGRPTGGRTRALRADAVAVGHGLTPATEITRLLGAEHRFDIHAGGWIPARDADLRASRPGLYVAGDGAGVTGAAAAELEGALAGLAAAADLGALPGAEFRRRAAPLRRRLASAARFGEAMARLMALKPAMVDSVPAQATVCRCEDISRAELEDAIGDGARDLNQLKAWTRCGMGPCQGRLCGETAATLLAAHTGSRETAGTWTPRVPLRPIGVSAATGEFDYEDIPIPRAAPL